MESLLALWPIAALALDGLRAKLRRATYSKKSSPTA